MPVAFCLSLTNVEYAGAEWGLKVSITELARDEEVLAAMYERIRALVTSGKSEEDAVARVSAELRAFHKVSGSAHFALNEAILQSRLKSGEWEEPMSSDDLKKFLPN